MANWSDDAVAKLKLKQEAQSQKDARFLEEQIIKKTQGLSFWKQIRASIKDNCAEFNEKYGGTVLNFQVGQEMNLFVKCDIDDKVRQLSGNYDQDSSSISWQCISIDRDPSTFTEGKVEIFVGANGTARMQVDIQPVAVDEVVAKMLDKLIFD